MTIFPFGGSSQMFFLIKGTATGILTRSAKDVDKGHTSKSVELLSWAIRGWNSCFTWHLYNIIYVYMGCFLKWWYPTTMGFPAKMIILIHFRVFWGYHRLRKHPYHIYISNIYIQSTLIWLLKPQSLKIRTTKGTMSSSSRACFSDGFLAKHVICNIRRQM